MKLFLTIFIVILMAMTLASCAKETPKSNYVLITYAFSVDPKYSRYAFLAETSDGDETSSVSALKGITPEDLKNRSTDRPYSNLRLRLLYQSTIPSTISTDINGHAYDWTYIQYPLEEIYPVDWNCKTLTSWTTQSDESFVTSGGGGLLLCQPNSK